jgi:leucyl aminopeptidase
MHISQLDASAAKLTTEAVVVGVMTEGRLTTSAREIDDATGGLLQRLFDSGELTGAACETLVLHAPHGTNARKILVLGLGDPKQLKPGVAYRACATASQVLSQQRHQEVAFFVSENWSDALTEAGVAGAIAGCHGQDLYRAKKKHYPFGDLLWRGGTSHAIEAGNILGESINLTRRLVNEPPDRIYPETFAIQTAEVAKTSNLKVEIWDKQRLIDEECGALLGVAQGSDKDPRLVILRHEGSESSSIPLALVGKGVTFDSGGYSLKPNDGMKDMKCDMAGAATVVGAMSAIGRLRLPINVIGIVGLVENLVSGNAFKLGDVLTARTGKTIEIHNTDAEGRLVLADCLATAVLMKAERLIDLATLTGACVVALGTDTAGLMTNDEDWQASVRKAADDCGELVWPLPMFPFFGDQIKSEVADIKNVGEGRWGGAITAAKFLEEFVEHTPWTHIDIAGPAYLDKPKPWCDGGASGMYVRTLVEVVRKLSKS